MKSGTITGFTTGGVAGLTTLEFERAWVYHDLKAAMDVFRPTAMRPVQSFITTTTIPGTMITARRTLRAAALLSPFIVILLQNGEITTTVRQNLTLVECAIPATACGILSFWGDGENKPSD